MRWITNLKVDNYRAFPKPVSIAVPFGQHLLIYGENGSGKSSIYNSIKDFFASSEATIAFKLNEFEKDKGNINGEITLRVSNKDAAGVVTDLNYTFAEPNAGSNHKKPEIIIANKIKGFLDYKRMIQAHSLDVPGNKQPNVFKLLIKELLAEHRVANPKGGATTVVLLEEYSRLSNILVNRKSNSKIFIQADTELKLLEVEVKNLLRSVFTSANVFLKKYFDNKLQLDVTYQPFRVIKPASFRKKQMQEEMFLRVSYAGKEINFYHVFLNEARLSALAISIYLASIKTYSLAASDLRILYLDDVFIGLDTGNRIPLLGILRDEFIKKDKFQLFISTYDRLWFETARNWFEIEKCKMKCIELFIDDHSNPTTPDSPVLIDPSNTLLENAIKHFEAKDYPAAANYLRKTCESELKRILPQNKTLEKNHQTGEIQSVSKLETLINNFSQFLSLNGITQAPFHHFNTYKKIVFNPLSHDDLEAPHYRKEIQNGIVLVQNLQKIIVKPILTVEDTDKRSMKLMLVQNGTTTEHKYEVRLLENLVIIQNGAGPIHLSVSECIVKDAGGGETKFASLNAAFDHIWTTRGYAAPTDYAAFHAKLKISNQRALLNLMTF